MTSTAMGLRRRSCVVLCLVVGLATLLAPLAAQTPTEIEEALKELSWRSIGPAEMGGRTVDIAGIPGDPTTVYMATGSGGLWKTLDGGTTWKSIFESGTRHGQRRSELSLQHDSAVCDAGNVHGSPFLR